MPSKVNSKKITDVSFAETSVKISMGGKTKTITQFADDANPIEFHNTQISETGMNCFGLFCRFYSPTPIIFSISVIPGSSDDAALYSMWELYRVKHSKRGHKWDEGVSAEIELKNEDHSKTNFSYKNGTMISGPGGPSSSTQGKMAGKTYTFAFAYSE